MKHGKFMVEVLAHVRACFCGKKSNRSVFFKLASLQYKRASGTDGFSSVFRWSRDPRLSWPMRSAAVRRVYCTKVLERSAAEIGEMGSMKGIHACPGI